MSKIVNETINLSNLALINTTTNEIVKFEDWKLSMIDLVAKCDSEDTFLNSLYVGMVYFQLVGRVEFTDDDMEIAAITIKNKVIDVINFEIDKLTKKKKRQRESFKVRGFRK